jgi:hypothetical protein
MVVIDEHVPCDDSCCVSCADNLLHLGLGDVDTIVDVHKTIPTLEHLEEDKAKKYT